MSRAPRRRSSSCGPAQTTRCSCAIVTSASTWTVVTHLNPQLFDADSTFVLEHGLAAGPGSTAISFRKRETTQTGSFGTATSISGSRNPPQDRLFLSDATFSRSVPLDQRATL